jgi:chromosome segregation ATPase
MLNLEQVRLLETKVVKAIEYVERVNVENASLRERLESYQKRIDELEVLVMRFKEDQGRIEDGILSALDRLNQFENAIEKSLKERGGGTPPAAPQPAPAAVAEAASAGEIFTEIPEAEPEDEAEDSLTEEVLAEAAPETAAVQQPAGGELDIF